MREFELHKASLAESIIREVNEFKPSGLNWIIKGDISGIQDFIFSVRSDKASKMLKGRSFFIQAINILGLEALRQELPGARFEVFYDGGGNFYVLTDGAAPEAVEATQKLIDSQCFEEDVHLGLSYSAISSNDSFSKIWQSINYQSALVKLMRFQKDANSFSPYQFAELFQDETGVRMVREVANFKYSEITQKLKRFNKFVTVKPAPGANKKANNQGISFFYQDLIFDGTALNLQNLVVGLPLWSEDLLKRYKDFIDRQHDLKKDDEDYIKPKKDIIIEFSHLTYFAAGRTGTDKLGVLKLDVDNLGSIFEGLKDWKQGKALSTAMSWFFGYFVNRLLESKFTDDETFGDNLYVVFSGGDDTFVVGAWDAVFEFTHLFRTNFESFSEYMHKHEYVSGPITFSASLSVFDPKFPVLQMAHAAESALGKAKSMDLTLGKKQKEVKQKPIKNNICVFGQILTWEEFCTASNGKHDARMLARSMAQMIQNGETSRSIIERIKRVAREYESLVERAVSEEYIPGPKVHKLFYTMRKWKTGKDELVDEKTQRAQLFEREIKNFSEDLLSAFTNKKKIKYPKYPVAARWAELLTRKSEQ